VGQEPFDCPKEANSEEHSNYSRTFHCGGGANATSTENVWVSREAELKLLTLPPRQRRAMLLSPEPSPATFIPLKRRLAMLTAIDNEAA
jgi:hypothetical protein